MGSDQDEKYVNVNIRMKPVNKTHFQKVWHMYQISHPDAFVEDFVRDAVRLMETTLTPRLVT